MSQQEKCWMWLKLELLLPTTPPHVAARLLTTYLLNEYLVWFLSCPSLVGSFDDGPSLPYIALVFSIRKVEDAGDGLPTSYDLCGTQSHWYFREYFQLYSPDFPLVHLFCGFQKFFACPCCAVPRKVAAPLTISPEAPVLLSDTPLLQTVLYSPGQGWRRCLLLP